MTHRTFRRRAGRPAALLGLALLHACGAADGAPSDDRAKRAAQGKGDVVVAVAWPWEQRKEVRFGEGLQMAVDEVNAAGGVHGRKLRLLREDDRESVNEGRLVAQRVAQNPDVVAVIGHLQSYITVPAAAIYDLAGLVMVSPASTDQELTSKGYPRLFRAIFTDRDVGQQMAEHAKEKGYRRVGIYYVRTNYGRALANAFEERAAGLGMTVTARASYDPSASQAARSFDEVLRDWSRMEMDAIFLAGEVPVAGQLVAAIRAAGITAPILGGDAMSSPALISVGGAAVEGTVVAGAFHADEPRPEVRRFADAFRKRYGVDPDPGSALGYDAVLLLAHGMRQAPTVRPDDVAKALHATTGWRGVTGPFGFAPSGDLTSRRMVKMVVRGGRFEYLPDGPPSADADAAAPARP